MTKPEESVMVQPPTKASSTDQTGPGSVAKATAKSLETAVPKDSRKVDANTTDSSSDVIKQDAPAEQSSHGGSVNGASQRGGRVAIGGHRAAAATDQSVEPVGGAAGASDGNKTPGKDPNEQGGGGERG